MNKEYAFEYTKLPYSLVEKQLKLFETLFTSLSLDFDMEMQTQSNWCWAATSVSVSKFYWKFSGWDQCEVANAELGLSNCCDSPVPSACNVPWYLDRALTRTNNFVSIDGPVSYEDVRSQLQSGRVVGARVGWSGGGGHFMVIYGCSISAGIQFFDIDDPIYGKSSVAVSTFQSSYQGSGTWTHTYFTKPFVPMIWIKPLLLKEPFIRKIWETRPLLQLKGLPPTETAELTLPQAIHVMGLDDLEEGKKPPEDADFIRVLEMDEGNLRAYYDLNLSEEAPEVRQMAGPGQQLDLFNRSLDVALELIESGEEEVELRQLRIPALYVDALWIHYDKPKKDVLIPFRAPGLLETFKPIPLSEALKILKEPAAEQRKMDDTMGA